jgi:hypothetical protein
VLNHLTERGCEAATEILSSPHADPLKLLEA